MAALVVDRAYGRPLLQALAVRAMNDHDPEHAWSRQRDIITYWVAELVYADHSDGLKDVRDVVSRLTVFERFWIYCNREGVTPPAQGASLEDSLAYREWRTVQSFSGRELMEAATGVAHAISMEENRFVGQYDPDMRRIPVYQSDSGTSAEQRSPRWRNFTDFAQYTEDLVRSQGIDPNWSDFLITKSINTMAFLVGLYHNDPETEPARQLVIQAESWVEQHHATLIARDLMDENDCTRLMQKIRRLAAEQNTHETGRSFLRPRP